MGLPVIDSANLPESVREIVEAAARTGDEVLIISGDRTVARIVPCPRESGRPLRGILSGAVWMADDFNGTPEDFEDCM